MPSILRLLTAAALAAVLAACGRTKPDAGPAQCAVTPEPVVVERRVYVTIPAALTRTEAVPEGPITQTSSPACTFRSTPRSTWLSP